MTAGISQDVSQPDHSAAAVFNCDGYDLRLHLSLDDITATWDELGHRNIFLSSDYLRALHSAPPSTMSFYYCTIWKQQTLCGIVYTQLDSFKAKQSISYHKDGAIAENRPGVLKVLRDSMASRIEIHTLLCGNSLVTGQHGSIFIDEIGESLRWRLIDVLLHELVIFLKSRGLKVRLLFVKDFFKPAADTFHMQEHTRAYHGFHAQPNMILDLDPGWTSFEDYLGALSSKYRVRVRRAFKKAREVKCRELTIEDLVRYKDKIIEYYRDIAENASFNLFILNPDYFVSVKQHLGDRFRIFGFFKGDKLIAFYSLMINDRLSGGEGDEIEAHFLGYEEETNRKYQLYHNMLIEMIDLSIALGVRRIIYGRTAMEIKSSVGAEPYLMYFYLQYQHPLINRMVPWIYNTLEPQVPWVQRHPFKHSDSEAD